MTEEEEKIINDFLKLLQNDKKALLEVVKMLSAYLKSTGKIK